MSAQLSHSAPITGTTPPALVSEAEALRRLNLPTSRRDWMRGQIVGSFVGGQTVYREQDVAALAQLINGQRSDRPPNFYTR